jgi:hypothetical protein
MLTFCQCFYSRVQKSIEDFIFRPKMATFSICDSYDMKSL